MYAYIVSAIEWAAPYLGTILAPLAALYLFMQTPFGAKIFDTTFKQYFDRKLTELKYDQDRKLADVKHIYEKSVEELRAELSHLTDRGKLSNEREYQALIAAWESFVAAYVATFKCLGGYSEHPALDLMTEIELNEYLDNSGIDQLGKQLIKKKLIKVPHLAEF